MASTDLAQRAALFTQDLIFFKNGWDESKENGLVQQLLLKARTGFLISRANEAEAVKNLLDSLNRETGLTESSEFYVKKIRMLRRRYHMFQHLLSFSGSHYDSVMNKLFLDDCYWQEVIKDNPTYLAYYNQGERHWASFIEIFGEVLHAGHVID